MSSINPSTERPHSRESAARNTHRLAGELLEARLPEGRVLDIPCGSGAFLKRMLNGRYDLAGADIESHPALPEVPFHSSDMNERLPFDDASFDVVVSIEGIEHIKRPFDFVRECNRILEPGGLLILTTPNISSLRSRWRWFLTGFHNKQKYPLDESDPRPRHHINMLSFPELRYMLHTNGFRIESVHTNRIKAISWVYAPLLPLHYLMTRIAFNKGAKNDNLRKQNREFFRQLFSTPILFGESIIVVARASCP